MEEKTMVPLGNSEIIWCNYEDRFITFGDELTLHVVDQWRETNRVFGGLTWSEFKTKTMTIRNDIRQVKAMACNNTFPLNSSYDVLVALGYINGRIVLSNFDSSASNYPLIGKEFGSKTVRVCNALDFCPEDNHLLASGFERARNEFSGFVWDLAHTGVSGTQKYHDQFSPANVSNMPKPLYEFGYNEIVHSLKWWSQNTIICGMNNKHIKIFDVRDPNKPKAAQVTKGVYGICLDVMSNSRFATYADNSIFTWDMRKLENPFWTSTEQANIVKMEWCPKRSNVLAVLLKDSSTIKLYEFKDIKNSKNEQEALAFPREISPFESNNLQVISSFSWHQFSDSRMAITSANGEVKDFKIIDRITLNWSPESEIIWTHGKKILQCIDSGDRFYESIDDIAVIMKERAQQGYGLTKDNLWQMFPKNAPLHSVWKWASLRIKLDNQENFFASNDPERLNGIYSILCSQYRLVQDSEFVSKSRNANFLATRHRFASMSRTKALRHCGWTDMEGDSEEFDFKMPCEFFIQSNRIEMNFTRLAAVLVFNGRISEAIDCIKNASNDCNMEQEGVSLSAIALSLSAFLTSSSRLDNEQLWVEMCSSLKTKLQDPYLKAIFAFLSVTNTDINYNYPDIINDSNLDIADRLAFACIYLSDESLEIFLNQLKDRLFQNADLRGILLTGLSEEGLRLFAKYVEDTSDVQTISLLLLWLLPNDIYNRDITKIWVQTYKNLLDRWRLWNIRCKFDIQWYSIVNAQEKPKQKIVVASRMPHVSNDSNYQQTCARCALCLTQLGTPAAQYKKASQLFAKTDHLSPFSSRWFTWCNSCRHIGHAHHMEDWFDENQGVCPVAQCNCRCTQLDKC